MTEYKENILDDPKDEDLVTCCGNCRKSLGTYYEMKRCGCCYARFV